MYDRPGLPRAANYGYPTYPVQAPQKHYPTAHSTSSAFSASANPNEDWTKISDLAERRRIQNRIAQRNYRKKLKKRLEDLERRAGSSSASPEPKNDELAQPESRPSSQASPPSAQRPRSNSSQAARSRTPEVLSQQYVLPSSDDRSMFSQQYTRQLSTSPPPFSYTSMPGAEVIDYSAYPHTTAYCGNGLDMPLYPPYLPPTQHTYHLSSLATPPIKQEFYADDDMSPFSMSYASIAGMDVTAAQSYHEAAASYDITPPPPPLCEGSPGYSTVYPRTPSSMPRTPPM